MVNKDNQRSKGTLFAQAYNRAKRALSEGFYLEAIILCDSLITDRMRLILASNHEDVRVRGTTGSIANFLISQKLESFDSDLWNDVLEWSRERNEQIHEMGRISGDPLVAWRTRLKKSKVVAEAGFELVNRVSGEARKHKL